jgi:hypothetical protein
MRIGWFIQDYLEHVSSQAESAFAAASSEFDEDRGVVVAAWAKFKKSDWYKLAHSNK